MTTRPTADATWATTLANRQTPGGGLRASGFALGDRPPAKTVNELWGTHGDWITYFAGLLGDHTVVNSRILAGLMAEQEIATTSAVWRAFAINSTGRIVAVGDGPSIATSDDLGMTWTARTPDTYDGNFVCATFAFGLFIIAGDASGGSATASLQTSPDGVTWTERQTLASNTFREFSLGSISGTTTLLVYADDGATTHGTLKSTNGTTWASTASTQALRTTRRAAAAAGGIWVWAGASAGIYTSPDGAVWTSRTFGSGDTMLVNEVRYNQTSGWVAYGFSGNDRIIQRSTDGTTWTRTRRATGSSGASTGGMIDSAHGAICFGDTSASVIRPCLVVGADGTASDSAEDFFGPGVNSNSWSQLVVGRTNVLLRGAGSGLVRRFAWVD
jgi:hypothetical protein